MKRLLLFFVFLATTTAGFSQFSDTAELNNYIRENIRDKRPDKVTAEQIQKAMLGVSNVAGSINVDSITQKNRTNAKTGTFISPNRSTAVYVKDVYHKEKSITPAGGAGNYGSNVGPLVSLEVDNDSLGNYRRSSTLGLSWSTRDTGQTVWGKNIVYAEPTLQSTQNFDFKHRLPGVYPYTIRSDQWFSSHAVKGIWRMGQSVGRQTGDTLALTTGAGWAAPSTFYSYVDVNNGPLYRHTGWLVGFNSYFQSSSVTGSSWDTFTDYYAGGMATNKGSSVKQNFQFFGDEANMGTVQNPWGFFIKGNTKRNYVAGSFAVGDSSKINLDIYKFYVNGASKFNGNIVQTTGRTLLGGAVDDGFSTLQINGKATLSDSLKASGIVSTRKGFVVDMAYNPTMNGVYVDNVTDAQVNTSGFARYYIKNKGTHAQSRAGLLMETNGGVGYMWMQSDGSMLLFNESGTAGNLEFKVAAGKKIHFTNGNVLIKTATDNGLDALQVSGNGYIKDTLKAKVIVQNGVVMPNNTPTFIAANYTITASDAIVIIRTDDQISTTVSNVTFPDPANIAEGKTLKLINASSFQPSIVAPFASGVVNIAGTDQTLIRASSTMEFVVMNFWGTKKWVLTFSYVQPA